MNLVLVVSATISAAQEVASCFCLSNTIHKLERVLVIHESAHQVSQAAQYDRRCTEVTQPVIHPTFRDHIVLSTFF
jgi:hypothetical protein